MDNTAYRNKVIGGMSGLRHLDLQRITEEERAAAQAQLSERIGQEAVEQEMGVGLPPPGYDPNNPGIPPGHAGWPLGSHHEGP